MSLRVTSQHKLHKCTHVKLHTTIKLFHSIAGFNSIKAEMSLHWTASLIFCNTVSKILQESHSITRVQEGPVLPCATCKTHTPRTSFSLSYTGFSHVKNKPETTETDVYSHWEQGPHSWLLQHHPVTRLALHTAKSQLSVSRSLRQNMKKKTTDQ